VTDYYSERELAKQRAIGPVDVTAHRWVERAAAAIVRLQAEGGTMTTAAPPIMPSPIPIVEALKPTTRETCDGCGTGTQALFRVSLPGGGQLTLCAHHAVKGGFVHPHTKTYLHDDNRSKGSDH
jgi:hypothetical protein